MSLADLPTDWHFFSTSAANWRTGNDLEEQIRFHKAAGYAFLIYLIPCLETETYDIVDYAPQVDGSYIIAKYVPEAEKLVRGTRKVTWTIHTHRKPREASDGNGT